MSKKYKCSSCVLYCEMDLEREPKYCMVDGDKANWEEVKEEEKTALPKLTAEVFDREDCPEWAKYAAVDMGGKAFWFESKPVRSDKAWIRLTYKRISGDLFDSSDWQNSLIERPEKKQACSDFVEKIKKSGFIKKAISEVGKKSYENLRNAKYRVFDEDYQRKQYINFLKNKKSELSVFPEWCKVGEWVYSLCGCDPNKGTYFQVTQIDDVCIIGENDVCHVYNAVRARLRPYNEEEMRHLVGSLVSSKDGDLAIVTEYDSSDQEVFIAGTWYNAKQLLRSTWLHVNNPCGVLEHPNEKGVWVE